MVTFVPCNIADEDTLEFVLSVRPRRHRIRVGGGGGGSTVEWLTSAWCLDPVRPHTPARRRERSTPTTRWRTATTWSRRSRTTSTAMTARTSACAACTAPRLGKVAAMGGMTRLAGPGMGSATPSNTSPKIQVHIRTARNSRRAFRRTQNVDDEAKTISEGKSWWRRRSGRARRVSSGRKSAVTDGILTLPSLTAEVDFEENLRSNVRKTFRCVSLLARARARRASFSR